MVSSGDSTEKVPIRSHMLEYFGLRALMLRLAVLITLVPMHDAVRLPLDTLRNLTDVSQSLEIRVWDTLRKVAAK